MAQGRLVAHVVLAISFLSAGEDGVSGLRREE